MGAQYATVAGADEEPAPASAVQVGHNGSVPSSKVAHDADNVRLLLMAETIEAMQQEVVDNKGNEGIFGKNSRRSDNSRLVTILLVLNYMIGSGILNAPQTFRDSGVAATTVLYLLACAAVWLGSVVLISAAEACSPERVQKNENADDSASGGEGGGRGSGQLEGLEYATLADRTLGAYGGAVVDTSIVAQTFGAVCSYVVLIGGLMTSLLGEMGDPAAGIVAWWKSFYFVTPLMVLLLVLPPCFIRHFSNLRWLSAFSLFAISLVACLIVFGSPAYAADDRASVGAGETALTAPILWWNWMGALAKVGSVVFSLNCAPAALHSYSAMQVRTVSEWKAVVGVSLAAGGILCYCTGIVGYLSFRSAAGGDILDTFSGPVAGCFKLLIVLHLVMYIPNEVVILRHSLFTMVGRDVMLAGFFTVSSVTVGVLAVIVGVVCALMLAGVAQGDLFGYILDLSGGVSGSIAAFIIPSLAYLVATKEATTEEGLKAGNGIDNSHTNSSNISKEKVAAYRVGCWILLLFGLAVTVIVPTAVVLDARSKL